jgi:hypothetical protein
MCIYAAHLSGFGESVHYGYRHSTSLL